MVQAMYYIHHQGVEYLTILLVHMFCFGCGRNDCTRLLDFRPLLSSYVANAV